MRSQAGLAKKDVIARTLCYHRGSDGAASMDGE